MTNKKTNKKISEDLYKNVLEIYPVWKKLNSQLKKIYTRGINFHEAISEYIVCYVNDYTHSLGNGSEDAVTDDGQLVQIKGTANFDVDVTSFGPKSKFDLLEFARLDQSKDELYLYRIPIDKLDDVIVNISKNETFKDQRDQGRRPRLSIIKKYIEKDNIEPYSIVNLINGEIERK